MKFPVPPPLRAERRRTRRPALLRVRIVVLVFSALVMAALTVDLASLRVRADRVLRRGGGSGLVADALINAATATNRYEDPAGRFSVHVPQDWEVRDAADEGDGVVLRGPLGMEFTVRVSAAQAGGLAALRGRLEEIEQRLNVKTSIEDITFQDRPALRRIVPLNQSTLETVDFVAGTQAVHLMISAPRETFSDLRPVLGAVLESVSVGASREGGLACP